MAGSRLRPWDAVATDRPGLERCNEIPSARGRRILHEDSPPNEVPLGADGSHVRSARPSSICVASRSADNVPCGDGLPARSFVAGPHTGLTDANAAPRMDAMGRQSHGELAWTDRIPSPGGWTPPSGVKPGWAWLPPNGASPRLEAMPTWVRLWYWTPFIDRWAYVWMWDRGGWWVEPPGSAPPPEDASVREPIRPTPPERNASVAKHLPGTS